MNKITQNNGVNTTWEPIKRTWHVAHLQLRDVQISWCWPLIINRMKINFLANKYQVSISPSIHPSIHMRKNLLQNWSLNNSVAQILQLTLIHLSLPVELAACPFLPVCLSHPQDVCPEPCRGYTESLVEKVCPRLMNDPWVTWQNGLCSKILCR